MNFDEQFYSRQVASVGINFMKRFSKLKIFIYGLNGLGIEIAKNLTLSGPEKITIYDKKKINEEDLQCNFFITEKDIGFQRDETCIKKLRELNNIECNILNDNNYINHLKNYDIVIITEILELEKLEEINDICHQNKIGFIYGLTFGFSFFCFIDYGKHKIINQNNKEPEKYYIKNIIKGKKTKIIIDDSQNINFNLSINDYIILKEIKGISQLVNNPKKRIISSDNKYFEIDEDSSSYDDYIEGGTIEEIKEEIIINYETIKELIKEPNKCEENLDEEQNLNMHIAFIVIHEYYKMNKKLPDICDFNDLLEIYKNMNESNKVYQFPQNIELNGNYFSNILKYAKYEIPPICGYGGGIISQEIFKHTGVYKPINQWFRYSFYEMIDSSIENKHLYNTLKYKSQEIIFGKDVQKNLENLNLFIVGAGAIGCELLKYFALMGISTNSGALLSITDHDMIEKSNLNRQFLFREKDIIENKYKSQCAVNSIQKINPKINCKYYLESVSEETKNLFNQEFFKKQNAVIMAVDNFEARNYIASQCEKYNIPYFNCGTENLYANVGVYIPGITKPTKFPTIKKNNIPPCTLKFFPSNILHCVSWSMNHFNKYFNENIKYVKYMHDNLDLFYEKLNQKNLESRIIFKKIKKYFKLLKISYEKNFEKCIKFTVNKFTKLFVHNILNTLQNYPPNKINKITGKNFWIGYKRLPHILKFDINDENCFEYIKNFSCLLAKCLDINISNIQIDETIKNHCQNLLLKDYIPKKYEDKVFYDKKIEEIKTKIVSYLSSEKKKNIKINYNVINYEKDSNDIKQLDFIYNSSILRAENFNIEKESKLKIKIMADEIMPSIITSTSCIAALLAIQLYVFCQTNNCNYYRVGMIDLSDNTINLAIPSLL